MTDYDSFRQVQPHLRRDWLDTHFGGAAVSALSWLGMAEDAEDELRATSTNAVDSLPAVAERCIALMDLAVQTGGVDPCRAVLQLARCASVLTHRNAVLDGLPDGITPDGVGRRALAAIPFDPDAALVVAERRRSELINDPRSVFAPGEKVGESPPPDDHEITMLMEVESMLGWVEEVVDHIRDRTVADAVRAWLDLRSQLDIGEEAAEAAKRHFAEHVARHRAAPQPAPSPDTP